jgi:hypothetical protein
MKLRKIYSHDAPTNNTAERRVGRRPYTDATHYRRLFADRAALATRQPCRGPHRVTLHNRASVAQRRCRCAPASNQSRHQVAFHVDQRHLVCRVYDSPSTSPHSPQCGRTGQRKTHVNPNQLCTELNAAVILAFSTTPRQIPSVPRPPGGLLSTANFKPGSPFRIPRSTCRRIIRVDRRLTLSFPLIRAERDWQTVSNSAVITATCQAG